MASIRPCASCGFRGKQDKKQDWLVYCCECKRVWHGNRCLHTKISIHELNFRNKNHLAGIVEDSWGDWKCRQCRGVGPEGREHRPRKKREAERTRQPSKTAPAKVVSTIDLTLDSDEDTDIVVVEPPVPSQSRLASIPPPPVPLIERIPDPFEPTPAPAEPTPVSAPVEPTPALVEILDSAAPDPDPSDALRSPPTPELRYPSERSADLEHQSELSVPDLTPMRLDTPVPLPPDFPFPDPTPYSRRFGSASTQTRPHPLPPALRPIQRSILGERLLNAVSSDKVVQMLGLRELKAYGWKCVRQDRESVALNIAPPTHSRIDKGKGRAPGERTRDWTPLVRREMESSRLLEQERSSSTPTTAQRIELRLVPPTTQTGVRNPVSHPPRQLRKRLAKARDTTVKQEDQEILL